jgi:peptidase M28-like protein
MSRGAGVLLALVFLMPIFGVQPQDTQLPDPKRVRDAFAAERAGDGPAAIKPITIDGKRTMKYLHDLCAIGPRISGSSGMKKQQELLTKHFENLGGKVRLQRFAARQVSRPQQPVDMANLIVSWHPERKRRVILCSHYDTRPIADQEPDERKWREPFVSANDGGSGVAVLMELGHHMKDVKTAVGVDYVFFDGEEFIWQPRRDKYFFGSEHFAREWKNGKDRPEYAAAILLDMIAGKGARFPLEGHSWLRAESLCRDIWGIARDLKCDAFVPRPGDDVLDDHLALQEAGIPAIDIIDFSYPHWHRLSDVPENCSAEAMEQVTRVLTVWLQRVR